MASAALAEMIAAGLAHCRAAIDANGSLFGALMIAGLAGSLSHCVGMCGPFVLAQTQARLGQVPIGQFGGFARLKGAALVPYHLGRGTTYAGLGALAGGLAGGTSRLGWLPLASAGLLALGSVLFLAAALGRLRLKWPAMAERGGLAAGFRALSTLARPFFAHPIGVRGYLLGVILGFLPCGLLYGALAVAAASGSMLAGALAMAGFTLGTVPALLGVALAGHWVERSWRRAAGAAAPLIMAGNGLFLAYLAWQTFLKA